jgi:putative ABC transport system permease protein
VQLFVLVALMAVQAVAVSLVLELVARGRLYRDPA